MKQDYTHMCVIIDESGSMEGIAKDTIGGFNTLVEDQKKKPGTATLTLVKFNTGVKIMHNMAPLADVKPLNGNTYRAHV
jgi:hypothetical protein